MPRSSNALPLSLPPRGLCRSQAAAYLGISPSLFDVMVKDGRMPKPQIVHSRTVWDRFRLDECFDGLPDKESCNPWDEEDEVSENPA